MVSLSTHNVRGINGIGKRGGDRYLEKGEVCIICLDLDEGEE